MAKKKQSLKLPEIDHPLFRPDPVYIKLHEEMDALEGKDREQVSSILRHVIKTDLYYLCKYVLGFWWLCWHPHKEFANVIQAGKKSKKTPLYLLPRGHCKTQMFTIGDTILE